jgi:hypothetical protein
MASKNVVDIVEAAVLTLNRTLATNGYRFVVFVEDTNEMPQEDFDEEDDEDLRNAMKIMGSVVAPNEEVYNYPISRLMIADSDKEDDGHIGVYSSHFNGLMIGELIGGSMGLSDKVSSMVEYGVKSWQTDLAASQVISCFSDEKATNDIEDLEDFS